MADLSDLVPDRSGELTVQRKTCCLSFALPQPKVCTGCLARPAHPRSDPPRVTLGS
ncbi:(2Fe-2S)-binding protein [Rhizomonospora bruguierae]|uniref:(2Fe-2S)-binding protein n=1 Tax=Rhizomonospora bruguierae TaxID=1581705 RepID=UPI0020C069E7|nr:(2Fe-2S)-binding protein [Micromonospora sp. NBRC 107566]